RRASPWASRRSSSASVVMSVPRACGSSERKCCRYFAREAPLERRTKRVRRSSGSALALIGTGWLAASCHHAAPPPSSPGTLQQLSGQSLFTCCNLHYENRDISDANYWVGKLLPAGTL